MEKYFLTAVALMMVATLLFWKCQNGIGQNNLAVKDFQTKIQNTPQAQLVDVRTLQEYAQGHLQNALNVDWNASDFTEKILKLDKEKPIFVYCLAGGRSASACSKLQTMGFKEVYNMQEGIAKWKAEQLPLTTEKNQKPPQNKSMTIADFDKVITQKDKVLIDFTAQWCAPCKKLKPILEKIAKENPNIAVVPVDYDDNSLLAEHYKIDAIPMLMIFEKGKKIWQHQGLLDEKGILNVLKK